VLQSLECVRLYNSRENFCIYSRVFTSVSKNSKFIKEFSSCDLMKWHILYLREISSSRVILISSRAKCIFQLVTRFLFLISLHKMWYTNYYSNRRQLSTSVKMHPRYSCKLQSIAAAEARARPIRESRGFRGDAASLFSR
jgi:hypothetical protein